MNLSKNIDLIRSEWKKMKNEVKHVYGIDSMNNVYITAKDSEIIITFVSIVTGKTFMIPKKYCDSKENHWFIREPYEMKLVSCKGSSVGEYDEYAKKILKKLK